jgi:hypothetical protein
MGRCSCDRKSLVRRPVLRPWFPTYVSGCCDVARPREAGTSDRGIQRNLMEVAVCLVSRSQGSSNWRAVRCHSSASELWFYRSKAKVACGHMGKRAVIGRAKVGEIFIHRGSVFPDKKRDPARMSMSPPRNFLNRMYHVTRIWTNAFCVCVRSMCGCE